jgi:CheY-like chemotaxis protein
MARVTIVNDNPEFLELMGEVLESERHETTKVGGDRPITLDVVRRSRPDLLILDLRLGSDELHGWDTAQEIRRDPEMAELPILLCSADLPALEMTRQRLEGQRAVEVLPKPFGIDELMAAIDGLLRTSSARG